MPREQFQNLTEPMYYILLSLISPRHGYDIMQYTSRLTDDRVSVGAGTLYALLARFEQEGLIRQEAEEGRKKIYRLTGKGVSVLEKEWNRLMQLVKDGEKLLGGAAYDE